MKLTSNDWTLCTPSTWISLPLQPLPPYPQRHPCLQNPRLRLPLLRYRRRNATPTTPDTTPPRPPPTPTRGRRLNTVDTLATALLTSWVTRCRLTPPYDNSAIRFNCNSSSSFQDLRYSLQERRYRRHFEPRYSPQEPRYTR